MERKIKKILVVTVPAVLVTLGITTSLLTLNNNAKADEITPVETAIYNLEQAVDTIDSAKGDDPVIVVNDETITKQQVEEYKQNLDFTQTANEQPLYTEKEVTENLITDTSLITEAESQGLSVSYDEAKSYAEQTRSALEDMDSDQAEEMKNVLADYIKALGISEEEYWNEVAPKAYQESLTIGALKQQKFEEEQTKNEDITQNQFEQTWSEYSEDVVKDADVEIVE